MRITGNTKTRVVQVDGIELRPDRSRALRNHSPDGYAWGYSGSGPAQLALAILLRAGVPEETALDKYHDFKREVIAALPVDGDFQIDIEITLDGQWART